MKLVFVFLLSLSFSSMAKTKHLKVEWVAGRPMVEGYFYHGTAMASVNINLMWDKEHRGRIPREGMRFSLAKGKRLIKPRLPIGCTLEHMAGFIYSENNPYPFGTISMKIHGWSCKKFIDKLRQREKFVFKFKDLPGTRQEWNKSAKVVVEVH
jgi:hypothetical protein